MTGKSSSPSMSTRRASEGSVGAAQVDEIKLPMILRQTSYQEIKADLTRCMSRASRLCLFQSQRWAAELLCAMDKIKCSSTVTPPGLAIEEDISASHPAYFCIQNAMSRYAYGEAVSYAKLQEDDFQRLPLFRFFYYYNRFLHGQGLWMQNCEGPLEFAPITEHDVKYSMKIREEIKQELLTDGLDPLMRYLYGMVLRQLNIYPLAREQLISAISEEPEMWCYWYELADCVMSQDDLNEVMTRVKVHWMRDFFLERVYSSLNCTEEAYGACKYLRKSLFSGTPYVMGQLARVCYGRREFSDAAKLLEKIRLARPARLEDMDFYSMVLDVRGDKARLAKLARDLHEIDPFAPETNIAIANYCRVRDQRDKTIEHLTLAIRAFPEATLAWLLLGHEYVELKNFPRATAAYQKVVELNPRDYKAWYGLGQVCENEKKHHQAAVHFRRSATAGPYDPRVWNALGDVYEKLQQPEDAKHAYWQAYLAGDRDDGAVVKLAKICERLEQKEQAVQAYERYVEVCEETPGGNGKNRDDAVRPGFVFSDVAHAYLVVADAYYTQGRYAESRRLALKAAAYSPSDEEVKSFCESILEPGDADFDERTVLEQTFPSEYMEQSLEESLPSTSRSGQ